MKDRSFLDPQLTSDGKPYGPIRYKNIVRERYEISKRMNTSYNELGEITPREREYLLEFIKKDLEQKRKAETDFSNTLKKKR